MTAHFDIKATGSFSLDQWPVTVCAWRGCCIEVFARAEHSVADCLRTLEAAGVSLSREARSPFAANRLKALADCIARHDFGGHGKVALKNIAEWERLYETRAFLAHGEVKATPHGIAIRHITFDGKAEQRLAPKQISRFEMLALLAEMEDAQKALHHQLGQIKAMARAVKPLAA
jgi:hypothetical protein